MANLSCYARLHITCNGSVGSHPTTQFLWNWWVRCNIMSIVTVNTANVTYILARRVQGPVVNKSIQYNLCNSQCQNLLLVGLSFTNRGTQLHTRLGSRYFFHPGPKQLPWLYLSGVFKQHQNLKRSRNTQKDPYKRVAMATYIIQGLSGPLAHRVILHAGRCHL